MPISLGIMFLMYRTRGCGPLVHKITPAALGRGKAKVGAPTVGVVEELRPYERSRCAEHGVIGQVCVGKECARPTGGSHALTTDAPEQRFNGVNLRGTLEVG